MLFINSVTGKVVLQSPTPSVVTHIQSSHSLLLSGSSDGYLRTHDPRASAGRTGGGENLVRAHSSGIQGLQTTGSFAFTIGLGERLDIAILYNNLANIVLDNLARSLTL
jgi:PAB-dependent poly(A)-specific ribonuclease subunit 2